MSYKILTFESWDDFTNSGQRYLITVFMVLEASVIVHETVQLLKTFVLLFCL